LPIERVGGERGNLLIKHSPKFQVWYYFLLNQQLCMRPLPVPDVSFNYEKAKTIPPLQPRPKETASGYRMVQADLDRLQEFRKCIECFLCQDVCHVIRDHEENKPRFAGPCFFIRLAELEMHPLDTGDRRALLKEQAGLGLCNITKCCSEVCPEKIQITDNGIIPPAVHFLRCAMDDGDE